MELRNETFEQFRHAAQHVPDHGWSKPRKSNQSADPLFEALLSRLTHRRSRSTTTTLSTTDERVSAEYVFFEDIIRTPFRTHRNNPEWERNSATPHAYYLHVKFQTEPETDVSVVKDRAFSASISTVTASWQPPVRTRPSAMLTRLITTVTSTSANGAIYRRLEFGQRI